MHLPSYVLTALRILEENACEGYLVGGCVRDFLLGKTPSDYDIAVSSLPEETETFFREFRVIETGIRHGTVTVVIEGKNLELTTYRRDGEYTDLRRPQTVNFTGNLAEDLSRRDFTVNALAYHPDTGIVDLFGGQADLKKKIIRCVGDPNRRFNEDALRILRALRFSSVLNFSVEETTGSAVMQNRKNLNAISAERKFSELKKLLTGQRIFALLRDYRPVFEVVIPEISALSEEEYLSGARAAHALREPALSLSALLCPLGAETVRKICRDLKTDNAFLKTAVFLTEQADAAFGSKGEIRRFKGECGEAGLLSLIKLKQALQNEDTSVLEEVLYEKEIYPTKISDLKISGKDLETLGYRGKALGEKLAYLLALASEGRIENTKEQLFNAAR